MRALAILLITSLGFFSNSLWAKPNSLQKVSCSLYGQRAGQGELLLLQETKTFDSNREFFEESFVYSDLVGVFLRKDELGSVIQLAFDEGGPNAQKPFDFKFDAGKMIQLSVSFPFVDLKEQSFDSVRGVCQL